MARDLQDSDLDPDTYRILRLRAEILELGSAARQLQRAGLDDAATQLLLSRKRAELDSLMKPARDPHPQS